MDYTFTGADLRKMRMNFKMSQKEFGEAIGIHSNTIINWEQKPHLEIQKTVRLAISAALFGLPPYFTGMHGFFEEKKDEDEE